MVKLNAEAVQWLSCVWWLLTLFKELWVFTFDIHFGSKALRFLELWLLVSTASAVQW